MRYIIYEQTKNHQAAQQNNAAP